MPKLTNITTDDLSVPALGPFGYSKTVMAGETVDISVEEAKVMAGHPLFKIDKDKAAKAAVAEDPPAPAA